MAKTKTKLTQADCDQLRHGMAKILEAKEIWERCAKGDPEVKPLIDEAVAAYAIASHYLCEFGDGNPEDYS